MAASQDIEIGAELSRIEETAKYAAQTQFEQAKLWHGVNHWLTIPAAALAAITGGSLLADQFSTELAGVLVLVSAALGGVATALGAAERAKRCRITANDYLALQSAARVARDVDLPNQPVEESRAALADLMKQRDSISKAAPVPSKRAWRRAKANVESGGQTYEVDSSP